MKAKQIFEQMRKPQTEAYHDDPHDPARRQAQLAAQPPGQRVNAPPVDPNRRQKMLAARPPGHHTTMLRKRINNDTDQLLQSFKDKHAANAGASGTVSQAPRA